MWFVVTLIVLAGLAYVLLMGPYNALVRLRNSVQESWRQIDVELNRRYDLIPNLVEVTKGYATHEHNTLEDVVALRNQARAAASGNLPTEQRGELEAQLSQAITQFMVVAEAYPDLKANQNFVELQRQLVDTENRIANGRRYYNAIVNDYNTKIESFPSNFAAGMFRFEKAGYFEANNPQVHSAPVVQFDQIDYRGNSLPVQDAVRLDSPQQPAALPVPTPPQHSPYEAPVGGFEIPPQHENAEAFTPYGGQPTPDPLGFEQTPPVPEPQQLPYTQIPADAIPPAPPTDTPYGAGRMPESNQ